MKEISCVSETKSVFLPDRSLTNYIPHSFSRWGFGIRTLTPLYLARNLTYVAQDNLTHVESNLDDKNVNDKSYPYT